MVNSALLVGNGCITGLNTVLVFGLETGADFEGPLDILEAEIGLTDADDACLTGAAGFTEADDACLDGADGLAGAFLDGAEALNKLLIESPPTMMSSVKP